MKTIYLFIMLLCLPLVYADNYHDDQTMPIEDFIQLNNSVLSGFNAELNNITSNSNNYVYEFEMDVYVDYWVDYYADPDDWETVKEHKVVPARLKFEWYCYQTYDCTTLFNEYIYDFTYWWLVSYYALIYDYTQFC